VVSRLCIYKHGGILPNIESQAASHRAVPIRIGWFIQGHRKYAIVKGYIGLDVHKVNSVIGVAKRGDSDASIHGKSSLDMRVFMTALRKLLKG
jgi:hypothetical protein